jgi:hypothetical protein
MKLKFLFCLAILAVAGCASTQKDPYAGYGEFRFTYDMVPPPNQGISPANLRQMYNSSEIAPPVVYG